MMRRNRIRLLILTLKVDTRRHAGNHGMSVDEEIVYDFTIELQKNKRVSDATFSRAEQRFGEKGRGRYGRHKRLLHIPRDAAEHDALRGFWRRSGLSRFPN
jgi:4-carboxymuconolactone decarboxylase